MKSSYMWTIMATVLGGMLGAIFIYVLVKSA